MKILHQEYEENWFTERFANNVLYEYHGKWYFFRIFDNETYELGSESLVKVYTWDFGKFNYDTNKMSFPDKISHDIMQMAEVAKRFPFRIPVQGQNNRYIMAQILLKNDVAANLIYDKSIHECKFIEHFTEVVEFQPYIVTNEYVLSWCRHGALEKYVTEEMLDEDNRQKFRVLINTVEEELNPVIIKYYFK